MPVVHIPASLRDCTSGEATLDIPCTTPQELLAEIKANYSDLAARIMDETDGLVQHIQLFIDGQQTDALATITLTTTSEILILSPLAGG